MIIWLIIVSLVAVAIVGPAVTTPFGNFLKFLPIVTGCLIFKLALEISRLTDLDRSDPAQCALAAVGFTAFTVLCPFVILQNDSALELYRGPISILYWWLDPKTWLMMFLISCTVYRPVFRQKEASDQSPKPPQNDDNSV